METLLLSASEGLLQHSFPSWFSFVYVVFSFPPIRWSELLIELKGISKRKLTPDY